MSDLQRRRGGWLPVALFVVVTALGLAGLAWIPSSVTARGTSTAEGDGEALVDDPLATGAGVGGVEGATGRVAGLGPRWGVVSGEWAYDDGSFAIVAGPERPGAPSLVVAETGSTDGWVAADAEAMSAGWGLVYRYVDPSNYSYIVAQPAYASYRIIRVANGSEQVLGSIAPAPTRNSVVVRVDFTGPSVTLSVNGRSVLAVDDLGPVVGTAVGLRGQPPSVGTARWGRVRTSQEPS